MSNERKDEVATTQLVGTKKTLRFSWINIGILCSAFSIVVLIVVGSYSGWYLITANTQLAKLAVESQSQLQQLEADFSVVQKNVSSTQQIVQQFADDTKNLKQTVNDISQIKQGNQEKWLLAEAHYYVKLANDNLQFSRNIPLAITLLKMADQEVSHITNPELIEVRKVIATDIANLQSAPQVDVAGLYMKLTALNSQLDQLPLLAQQKNLQEEKPVAAAEQKQMWWQRGLYASWQALQSIVVVRYNPNGLMPLMVPEQKTFLYQNLHAMLAQAIWALLHQQPAIYQSSLQQVIAWIKQYFILDAPMAHAVLSDLTQLEKIDVYPPTPTITNTLQAFNGVEGP